MTPELVKAAYAELRSEVGDGVTIVAATKYVPLEEMGVLVEAGVEVVGENRAQDLERKHAAYGDAFRWHFIGHLQSNKVKVVNRICELVAMTCQEAPRRCTVHLAVGVKRVRAHDRDDPLPQARRIPEPAQDRAGEPCAGSRMIVARDVRFGLSQVVEQRRQPRRQ